MDILQENLPNKQPVNLQFTWSDEEQPVKQKPISIPLPKQVQKPASKDQANLPVQKQSQDFIKSLLVDIKPLHKQKDKPKMKEDQHRKHDSNHPSSSQPKQKQQVQQQQRPTEDPKKKRMQNRNKLIEPQQQSQLKHQQYKQIKEQKSEGKRVVQLNSLNTLQKNDRKTSEHKNDNKLDRRRQEIFYQKGQMQEKNDEYDLDDSFICDDEKESQASEVEQVFEGFRQYKRKKELEHHVERDDDIPEDGYEYIEAQDRKSRLIGMMVDRKEKEQIKMEIQKEMTHSHPTHAHGQAAPVQSQSHNKQPQPGQKLQTQPVHHHRRHQHSNNDKIKKK